MLLVFGIALFVLQAMPPANARLSVIFNGYPFAHFEDSGKYDQTTHIMCHAAVVNGDRLVGAITIGGDFIKLTGNGFERSVNIVEIVMRAIVPAFLCAWSVVLLGRSWRTRGKMGTR